jgi:predicted dehydrogenase
VEHILIKLGVVGAGSIVPTHLQSARLSGFEPVVICGKKNSLRANLLASQNQGLSYAADLSDLLKYDLDALLIATSPEDTIQVINDCLGKKIPIIVEKPVGISTEAFKQLKEKYYSEITVAFNRRFYSAVQAFKSDLKVSSNGLIQINIPELSWISSPTKAQQEKMLIENAVHIFDLMHYLFGEILLTDIQKLDLDSGSNFQVATFKTRNGSVGSISLGFGAPNNLAITFWTNGKVLELLPIEKFARYTDLEIEKPSELNAIKTYKKKDDSNWKISSFDLSGKPGFVSQYQAFAAGIRENRRDPISANIWDSIRAIKLAENFSLLGDRKKN